VLPVNGLLDDPIANSAACNANQGMVFGSTRIEVFLVVLDLHHLVSRLRFSRSLLGRRGVLSSPYSPCRRR